MNIVFLAGGLGNQLFQIAFGIDRYGLGNFYVDWSQRDPRNIESLHPSVFEIIPALQDYKINRNHNSKWLYIFYKTMFSAFHGSKRGSKFRIVFTGYLLSFFTFLYFGARYRMWIRFVHDSNLVSQNKLKGELCAGYFQTSKYIENIGLVNFPINLDVSSLLGNQILERSKVVKPIVAHVRLGDYLNNSEIGVLNQGYYKNALDLILVENTNPIWVFTDSEDIVHNFLPNTHISDIEVIGSKKLEPSEVLSCMLHGSAYIISNSTLAWWAAYLRKDSQTTVVAPAIWFNLVPFDNTLLPSSWIKVFNKFA
jgi:hypothetical protein